MSERVFCIDFGASYTKVALRTAPQEASALVPYFGRDLWAPTVVAVDWSSGKPKPDISFGETASGMKPSGKTTIFTNFKRDLFAPPPADKPGPHPLDALLQSEEFEALAAKYNVLPASVAGLRTLVGSARAVLGVPADRGVSVEARRQDDAKKVTAHFFRWLHDRVMESCEKLPHTALNYRDIPLRVSVPVLGSASDLEQHPGCQRLREALALTGWKLDDRLFVPEPESNAVGVLTKATNALTRKKQIDFGEMFNKGPLITVMKGDPHHTTYRALVIDVGAFTTDFSSLLLTTDGKYVVLTQGGWFDTVQRSIPLGVNDLDASVKATLPETKRAALDGLSRRDFSAFQDAAYTEAKGYRVAGLGVIGGEADRDAVQAGLDGFAKKLADETATFCQQLGAASKQELILTGGGCNIPAVRDALIAAVGQMPGNPAVKTHAPGLKKAKAGPPVDSLDEHFARGGSALGGASVYFEKAYN